MSNTREKVKTGIIVALIICLIAGSIWVYAQIDASKELNMQQQAYAIGYQRAQQEMTQGIVQQLNEQGFITLRLPTFNNETNQTISVPYHLAVIPNEQEK